MIVKDEAPNLPRALNSLQGVADELLVVDTGSTDGTPDLARQLGARVLRFDWTGSFSDARNFALEQARGEWALIMDADEELHPADAPLVRRLLGQEDVEAYIFTAVSFLGDKPGPDTLVDHRVYLVRRRPEYRYTGVLHENILDRVQEARPGARIEVAPVRVLHYGYLESELARKGKRERNLRILEERLRCAPDDPFLEYALAIEYLALGELDRARDLFMGALRAGPEAPFRSDLFSKLAFCLRQLGDRTGELAWLQQAAEEYPDYTDIWFQLALAYRENERWVEAETCLRLCLALGEAPSHYQSLRGCGGYRAWLALGEVYESKGSPVAARKAYLGCLQADPENREALDRLVRLTAREEAPVAVQHLAVHFDLTSADTVVALAGALRRAGTPCHAHRLLRTAKAPPAPALYLELARACLAEAERLYRPGP